MRIYTNEFNAVIFAKDDGTIIRAFPTGNFEVTLLENNKIEIKNPIFGYQEAFLFSDIKTFDGSSTGATIADTINYLSEKVNFRKGGISEEDLIAENITELQGEEGSVQYKNALGKLFGDAFLLWKSRLLTVLGSLYIKSESNVTGNAVEVRSENNTVLCQVTNSGEFQTNKITGVGGNNVNYTVYYDAGYANTRGIYGVRLWKGQNASAGNLYADFGSNNVISFYKRTQADTMSTKVLTVGDPLFGVTYDLTIQGQAASPINGYTGGTSKSVVIEDGKPRPDDTGFGYDGLGVIIKSWRKETGTDPVLEEVAKFQHEKVSIKLPVFADNAAALVELDVNDWYTTAAGDIKRVI
ncbi:hypothetical protein ACE193_15135 [Bernardetia sp. OM2101]|uniref:hypothetical protein n=1 Tax=Bernardetia sp. OM2101 TaxID=3344876 RepID=UPI0035D0D5DF